MSLQTLQSAKQVRESGEGRTSFQLYFHSSSVLYAIPRSRPLYLTPAQIQEVLVQQQQQHSLVRLSLFQCESFARFSSLLNTAFYKL